jgi:hypothetical protein
MVYPAWTDKDEFGSTQFVMLGWFMASMTDFFLIQHNLSMTSPLHCSIYFRKLVSDIIFPFTEFFNNACFVL